MSEGKHVTDLTHGTQICLRRMADEGGTFEVTVADKRPPIKRPTAARRGVALAPFLRGSWGLR